VRGHIAKKGSRYFVVVDVGYRPAQRCTDCARRVWIERRPLDNCPKCGGELVEREERRQKWHGGFATKREAQRALTGILGRLDAGTYIAPTRRTLGHYLGEWLPGIRHTIRASTWESYERNVRSHVLPRLGHVHLEQLTATALNGLYADLVESGRIDGKGNRAGKGPGLSPRTVHYIHTILHRALKDAVEDGLVVRNVAASARPPRQGASKRQEMQTWTPQELRAFLAHVADDRLYPVFMLAATTGMRRGEVLGLRWRDLDLAVGRLAIRQTLIAVRHQATFSEPKTGRGRRSVALDPATVATLRAQRVRQAEEKLAIGPHYRDDLDLVFAREEGSPLQPEAVTMVFDRRVATSGLPRIRFHDLRHTHATLALAAGVHPKVVSERLGHAGIAITLDTYSHAIPAMQEEAAGMVAKLVFGQGS